MKQFFDLQLSLLQRICLQDLSAKALLRQGRNLLHLLKKSKQFLRQNEQDEHWLAIKALVLANIEELPSLLKTHILELSPEDDHILISISELISNCAIVLYEESQLDNASAMLDENLNITEAQIRAMQKLNV